MADGSNGDEILIKVGLDTTSAEQGTEALKQKIKAVGDTKIDDTSVKGYKAAIRDLTAELQILERTQGRNSQAFRDGAIQLGKLKLAQKDFADVVESSNPANKLAGISNIAKGAAVGLTGAASAMALFGVNGGKAQEVMLRLQAILGLSHAISSIHELASGWNSFKLILGLTSKNVETLTEAQKAAALANKTQTTTAVEGASEQVAANETVVTSIVDQQAAEEALAAATLEVNQLRIDSEEAVAVVKAEGTALTEGYTESEVVAMDISLALSEALKKQTAAQLALNEAKAVGTEANVAGVATNEALATSEVTATGAAVGLKVALFSIGIGLLITAVAYLVSNWKELKKSITDLFPALGQIKSVFKDFQNDLLGVGSVVIHFLKAPIDQAITGIKILIDLMRGDFKAASKDFQDGLKQQMDDFNVLQNFNEGKAKAEAKDAEEANRKRVALEIDANERIIKARKALGENTTALQVKNLQLKIQNLNADKLSDDDYAKQKLDLESEITVTQNEEIKKRNDKAAALRKQALDKLKSGNDAASKIILGGVKSQREIELADADYKYTALIAIAKKYGQDSSKLIEARGIEENRINKKYSDEIKAYLIKADEDTLTEFDKKRLEITKAANEALKNANPQQKQQIIQSQTFQLGRVDSAEKYSDAADAATLNQTQVEDANRPGVQVKPDSLEVAAQKEQAIRDAKLATLQANYQKERDLAAYNYDKLKQLDAQYQKDSHDIQDENTKAKIELSNAEREAKLKDLDIVGNALGAFGALMGKNTVAAKLLGIANATISTYVAASQTLADPTLPFFAKFAAVAGTIATGLAQVKQILAVQVPGAGGSGTQNSPSYSAPTINSTVLNQSKQGIQQVQVVNQQNPSKQEPVRAYVVEKDITSKQDRAAYLNRQSTI